MKRKTPGARKILPSLVVFPILPLCQGNGERCRFSAPGQRTRDAEFLLVCPEGKPNPGGWYCKPHADLILDEFLRVLGEKWRVVPLRKASR